MDYNIKIFLEVIKYLEVVLLQLLRYILMLTESPSSVWIGRNRHQVVIRKFQEMSGIVVHLFGCLTLQCVYTKEIILPAFVISFNMTWGVYYYLLFLLELKLPCPLAINDSVVIHIQ